MDENKIITEALDSLIPDNQQKDDIWQRIEACTDVYDLDKTARTEVTAKKSSKKSRSGSMAARIIAVAAAFVPHQYIFPRRSAGSSVPPGRSR